MSINNVAAFQGWNSSIQGWNTGTWNTNVAFPVTATTAITGVATTGDGVIGVTGTSATGGVGSVTTVGEANISVTGVAGTAALGSFFVTNTMVTMTSYFRIGMFSQLAV